MNRDLSRRIRTVSGLTVDKKVVRNDIRLAAKVITNLDKRWDIWTKDQPEAGAEVKKVNSTSRGWIELTFAECIQKVSAIEVLQILVR